MLRLHTIGTFGLGLLFSITALGDVLVNTGLPDGLMGALSRQGSAGLVETETADDFLLNSPTSVTGGSFYGLIGSTVPLSDISQVTVEIYHVFPKDSTFPPSGNVLTRTNSPSDVEFDSRDSVAASLSFSTTALTSSFTVANSVVNGINKLPNSQTGGEGPVSGQEVRFDVTFATPFLLPADHYFFVPQVTVPGGFLWLSAPKPIIAPGLPFTPDLQAWIRNENLAPDWLRIGTDIVGGSPAPTFNMAFTLDGTVVPEPSVVPVILLGAAAIVAWRRKFLG
jgi:hypothetical protein